MSSGPAFDPYKIIVGIDYGTTYSGVSFVTSNKSSDDIVIVSKWPNHTGSAWKAPSTIAYSKENPKLDRNHFGFEVGRSHKHYVWTKLLLDGETDLARHDDPLLSQMYGSGFLKLPRNKSAKDVVQDYLRELYLFTMGTLERELTARVVKTMPMECWITMPAIWSDRAQADTRAAAIAAGFGSRSFDRVNMISEPEAAALYALKPHLGPKAIDPVQPGEHVVICDCGGGTVDLITYEVLRTTPSFSHKEKCRGTGAKCGATSIDRRFVDWMARTFGSAYTTLDMRKRGPGSLFMKGFESVKRQFGHRDSGKHHYEVEPIDLDLEAPSLLYDEDEQCVKVPRHEMLGFFDPAIDASIELIEDQVSQLRRICGGKIDRFILVGGFGDSPYLNSRLRAWCNQNGIQRFTCPSDCQAAIVKGAALRGLEGIRPTSIVAKRHYGWLLGRAFREGVDDEANAYVDEYTGEKRCPRMEWKIRKGQELDASFKIERELWQTICEGSSFNSTLELYSSALQDPPDWADRLGVRKEGKILTRLQSIVPTKIKNNEKTGKKVFRWQFHVQVDFRSETGILGFKTLIDGAEAGTTTIAFEY